MTELWDVREAAKRTKTSVALWRKLIAQRKIAVVRVGRCVRLDPEHVTAFLAARTQRPSGDSK
jgi:excisionase family DNA binding protein